MFRQLVLARIIEPTSKQDSLGGLAEAGIGAASYSTLNRRLPIYAKQSSGGSCPRRAPRMPAGTGAPGTDVSRLYVETDAEDRFREPGFSKERRLDPQITIGLLTHAAEIPLIVQAFEGNKAETRTMPPVITTFTAAHQLTDVTVVADAG